MKTLINEHIVDLGRPYIFTLKDKRKVIVIHGSRPGPNGTIWDVGVDSVIGEYGNPSDAIGPYDFTNAPKKP